MVSDKKQKEDIYYFMLHCTAYKEERSQSIYLQQPYIESKESILLGPFLFDKENIEEKERIAICHMESETNED